MMKNPKETDWVTLGILTWILFMLFKCINIAFLSEVTPDSQGEFLVYAILCWLGAFFLVALDKGDKDS